MKKKRTRSRPTESFEVRLLRFASAARASARKLPLGRERDALMKMARQTENVLDVSAMLTTRNTPASK
jgi:hypothetical protein